MERIDIRKVFKSKSPKVAKMIPGFIYKYIERIVHQKDINNALPIFGNKMGLDFVKAVLEYFKVNIHVVGEENIPKEGRYIFVANHPLGGLDGLVFAYVVGKTHPDLQFLVNDILMNIENLDPIFIPVNKHGRQSVEYVRKIEDAYESDTQILNFPAGLCSRKIKGKIQDLEWKKSFVAKAVQHKRDVVPVHINGKNSNFFYNLSNFRGNLGIKTNIEMFYLVDEMFNQQNKDITLTFGSPISYEKFDKSMHPKDWAIKVQNHIYKLAQNYKTEFE